MNPVGFASVQQSALSSVLCKGVTSVYIVGVVFFPSIVVGVGSEGVQGSGGCDRVAG